MEHGYGSYKGRGLRWAERLRGGDDYTNAQKNFSVAVADEIDKEIRKIIEDAHNQALQIISDRRDDVTLIAETLLEYETINEEQINYLLENRKMPEGTTQKDSALSSINTLKESENKDAEVEKTEENPAKVD